MFTEFCIYNFLGHKETVIPLSEGVNALIGATGQGKSAVFKALGWLFNNRPTGEEYRSWWGGNPQVEIATKEGLLIGRKRIYGKKTKTDDYYYIQEDTEKNRLRNFGNGSPPQKVLDLLNLSEVNFQQQLDPAFLISNNSGEVARYLNRVAHLDIIDEVLSIAASEIRNEKAELNRFEIELKENEEKIKEYDWLKDAEKDIAKLENIENEKVEGIKKRTAIFDILAKIEETEYELNKTSEIVKYSDETERLFKLNTEADEIVNKADNLDKLLKNVSICLSELSEAESIVRYASEADRLTTLSTLIAKGNERWNSVAKILDGIDATEVELQKTEVVTKYASEVEKLAVRLSEMSELKKLRSGISEVLKRIYETSVEMAKADNEYKTGQKKFDELMGDYCPLCGKEVTW